MTAQSLRVEPLTPAIGGLVHGVDLQTADDPATYEALRQALWKHHVLFIRDQPLGPAAFQRLGEAFGKPEQHEYFPHVEGFPNIQVVASTGRESPDTDYWHADVTFRARPSMVQVLRAVDLPPSGGDTLWASTGAAFDAMPPALQECLLKLTAIHDLPFSFRRSGYLEKRGQMDREIDLIRGNPAQRHPVVINHPVTGRLGLFVNAIWTKRIEGMDRVLGDHLLAMVAAWMQKPEFQVRFRWEPGSIAIWDNFATQHYATFDYAPHARLMHRMTCGAATPALTLAANANRPAA